MTYEICNILHTPMALEPFGNRMCYGFVANGGVRGLMVDATQLVIVVPRHLSSSRVEGLSRDL